MLFIIQGRIKDRIEPDSTLQCVSGAHTCCQQILYSHVPTVLFFKKKSACDCEQSQGGMHVYVP